MLDEKNLPAGFRLVKEEDLAKVFSLTGARSSVRLFEGDKITVGSIPAIFAYEPKDGGATRQVPYICDCTVNGKDIRLPLSVFRRFPKDPDEFFAESPFMRELYNAPSDYERFNAVKGKKLVVAKVITGQGIDWRATTDPKNPVWAEQSFPIFAPAK